MIFLKVIGHLFFEKMEDFYSKFIPTKEILEKDAKNYTYVEEGIQISRVMV